MKACGCGKRFSLLLPQRRHVGYAAASPASSSTTASPAGLGRSIRRESCDDCAVRIQDLELYGTARGLQIVVDECAVRTIWSHWFIALYRCSIVSALHRVDRLRGFE